MTTINSPAGHGRAGRHPSRSSLDALAGHEDPGMFGRMFPGLPPLAVDDAALQALAGAMKDANPGDPAGNNERLPAGFTYLGQFIDHDITLDLTSIGEKVRDPLAIANFRTPSLDLDSVYGRGPDGSPHLYARNANAHNTPGPKLLIGTTVAAFQDFGNVPPGLPNDLPRSPEGIALIGDHRNDENLVVAQTHLAFLKFHNAVVDLLRGSGVSEADLFAEARRLCTWHYQWMVLHDFVERLTEEGIVARILHEGRKFYRFKTTPYMPVEFSAAIFRLGHSMVREIYSHNRIFTPDGGVPASLQLLFEFSGNSGGIVGDLAPDPLTGPTPVSLLPSNWIIDWRRYHELQSPAPAGVLLNRSRKLDPFIVPRLHDLPGGGGNLALRNLRRGVHLGLPSGQSVAAVMQIGNALTPDEISSGSDGAVARANGLHLQTPLWYYILKEAHVRGGGERLGPVGARLLAEVFVGLVHGDHKSYLWQQSAWRPTLPAQVPGTFTMADLLRFVGDISPIDGIGKI
jgi:hypothetical protein